MKMNGVEEQMRKFNQLTVEFSKRLAHHLNNTFIHQVCVCLSDFMPFLTLIAVTQSLKNVQMVL